MEMVETVTRRELPDAFDGTYDAKGVHNICKNEFHDVGGTATRWVAHNTFEFTGFHEDRRAAFRLDVQEAEPEDDE